MEKTTERDSVLIALEDALSDIAEEMGGVPEKCQQCPPYLALAKFASKIRKAKSAEEERIARHRRDKYDI